MTSENVFQQCGLTQATLAKMISGTGVITNKLRIRAHRIWHGAMPHEAEMKIIHEATGLSADVFYGLKKPKSKPKRTN